MKTNTQTCTHKKTVASHPASAHANGNGNHGHPLMKLFRRIAQFIGKIVGAPWCFLLACLFVFTWFVTGPIFNYSNTWQLVINTSTTIVTFLMVFLLQNTQNRDTKAMHQKLDELIFVHRRARNILLEAEDEFDDDEIKHESEEFKHKRQL